MRLEWIEDILSVLDAGSLAGAAERRFLTQSAFSRRVRAIEEAIGVTLFDRSRKPVGLMPGIAALEPELRRCATELRRLRQDLRQTASHAGQVVAIACQHALATSLSARIVAAFAGQYRVQMRAGNREDCLLQLVSGEADIAVIHDIPDNRLPGDAPAFETALLGRDRLVAVAVPELLAGYPQHLPLVAYPNDAFLGRAFDRHIAPHLPEGLTLEVRAETALTPGMVQLVQSGIGAAWLPQSLVADALAAGLLQRVPDLPDLGLEITMIRLSAARGDARKTAAWQTLAALS